MSKQNRVYQLSRRGFKHLSPLAKRTKGPPPDTTDLPSEKENDRLTKRPMAAMAKQNDH